MDWMQVDPLSLDAFHYEHFLDYVSNNVTGSDQSVRALAEVSLGEASCATWQLTR
jgi:hypothetical protein